MRKVVLLGLIALGFSLPVLLSHEDARLGVPPGDGSLANAGDPAVLLNQPPIIVAPNQSTTGPAGSPFRFASSSADGPPIVQNQPPVYNAFTSPADYLNFAITPDWVRTRWPRVSIAPGEDNLTGMRVALVSGPRPVDVHGSLTYYFDGQQKLQRITFRGWTGDPGELVQFVTNQFRFSAQDAKNAAGFHESTIWGRRKGFLRLDYPAVIDSATPTEQLMLLMEIVNPSGSLTISRQNLLILEAMENN